MTNYNHSTLKAIAHGMTIFNSGAWASTTSVLQEIDMGPDMFYLIYGMRITQIE